VRDDFRPLHALSLDLLFRELDKRPAFVLDIGANDGGYSRIMAEKAKKVHAFEPVPDMFEKLCHMVQEECPNVVPFNVGVSDKPGYIKNLQVYHAWTLLPPGADRDFSVDYSLGYDAKPRFDMHIITIDHHSDEYGDPDLIKLDVDGYEFKVLRGAVQTLRRKPCPIYFEFSYMPQRFFGESVSEMCDLIYSLGYRACSLDGAFVCKSAEEMMDFYPEHTSFDIMLLHESAL